MPFRPRLRALVVASVLVAGGGVINAPAQSSALAAVETGLLQRTTPGDVLVTFRSDVPPLDGLEGLDVVYRFAALPAVYATATPAALRALSDRSDVAYLESNKALKFDLDTATVASRARDVTDPAFDPSTPAILDDLGRPVDGRGVGIAVVDTGLDGLHPDYQAAGKVGGNYQVTPAGLVPSRYTSPTDGHGTHVAGIAAGAGTHSLSSGGPDYRGVAPGATLYAFNMYNGTQVLAAIAFDWIIKNGRAQDPPIRIVNNSWHCIPSACKHPFNAGAGEVPLHIALASQMAEQGFVVTWAVGNVRGTGEFAATHVEATNPTPGIIGVANYKDDDSSYTPAQKGRRDGCLSGSSAWGASNDPTTWPDVAAPGRSITSTWAVIAKRDGTTIATRNPVTGASTYYSLTGTSMAAPHVAGIVAQLLQLRPELTPAEIEYILKQTATPLTGPAGPGNDGCGIPSPKADPAHPWTGSNYAAGHGLVHAYDAAQLARAFTGVPSPPPANEPLPQGFVISTPGVEVDATWYLSGESALAQTYPNAERPQTRAVLPNTFVSYHSAAFDAAATFDAIKVDAYIGTSGEYADLGYLGGYSIRARVFKVAEDGEETQLAELSRGRYPANVAGPVHREFVLRSPAPMEIAAGDQLKLSLGILAEPYYTTDPPINAYWVLYSESFLPSRVGLGRAVAEPAAGTRAACERQPTCAELDATHPFEGFDCGTTPFEAIWNGPPGSRLIFSCDGVVSVCVVADDPTGENGSCRMDIEALPAPDERATIHPDRTAVRYGYCTYRLPDGGLGGWGRCAGVLN